MFQQYQYGGNQADGIGFFLVDGATPATQVGGAGGSLGYAQLNGRPRVCPAVTSASVWTPSATSTTTARPAGATARPVSARRPGAEGRIAPNIVTLRGPGNGMDGYCFLDSTAQAPRDPPRRCPARCGRPARQRPHTGRAGLVNVQVTPAPDPRVIVQIDFTGTGTAWVTVLDTPAPAGAPVHLQVRLPRLDRWQQRRPPDPQRRGHDRHPLNELDLVKQVSRAGAPPPPSSPPARVIPYEYVVTNAGLETLTGLTVTDDRVTGSLPHHHPAAGTRPGRHRGLYRQLHRDGRRMWPPARS